MEEHILRLMGAAGPWSANRLAAQLQLPLDAVLRKLEKLVTAGRVTQHGWNPQGMALFWLPEQMEDQLWRGAENG